MPQVHWDELKERDDDGHVGTSRSARIFAQWRRCPSLKSKVKELRRKETVF